MRLLLLALAFTLPISAANWVHDGTGCMATSGNASPTVSCNVVVGSANDLVVAVCNPSSLANTCSVTATSLTFTQIGTCALNRTNMYVFGALAPTAATYSVTATSSAGNTANVGGDSFKYSGGTVNAPSGANTVTACSVSTSAVNITSSFADTLPIGACDASSSLSAGAGYTGFAASISDGLSRTLGEYGSTATGTISASCTVGSPRGILAIGFGAVLAPQQVKHRVIR